MIWFNWFGRDGAYRLYLICIRFVEDLWKICFEKPNHQFVLNLYFTSFKSALAFVILFFRFSL